MDLRLLIVAATCAVGCGRLDFQVGGPGDSGPVPRCTGHDEDGDGFPDACDVCPTVPDPLQLDLGELMAGNTPDGVGDACDPRPTLGGDYLLVADMHTDPGTGTYWQVGGASAWGSDALRLGSSSSNGFANYILPSSRITRLESRTHVIDVSPTVIHWFGVWYDGNGASHVNEAFATGCMDPPSTPQSYFGIHEQSTAGGSLSPVILPPTLAPGQEWNLVVETALATGTTDVLTVTDGNGAAQTTSFALTIPPATAGYLEAVSMTVDFDHFVVYAVP